MLTPNGKEYAQKIPVRAAVATAGRDGAEGGTPLLGGQRRHPGGHIAFFLPALEKGEHTSCPVRTPKYLIHHAAMVPHSSRAGDRQRGFYASGASSTIWMKEAAKF